MNVNIYAVDGNRKPTGASLASGSAATSGMTGGADGELFAVTLSTPGELTKDVEYALVCNCPASTSGEYVQLLKRDGGDDDYPVGISWFSIDSQASWGFQPTDGKEDTIFKVSGIATGSELGDPALKESKQTGDNTTLSCYVDHKTGQSFLTTSEYYITSVKLRHAKTGNPGQHGTVSIYAADGSRFPTGAALATVTMIPVEIGSTNWYEYVLPFPLLISDATEYVIVLDCPLAGDTSNKIGCRIDSTSSSYTDGQATSTSTGDNWGSAGSTADFTFEVWGATAGGAGGGGNFSLLSQNGWEF
jgi:hypothetical protein